MDSDHHRQNSFSFNKGSLSNLPHHHHHHGDQLNAFISSMPVNDDNEDDQLNDETFGDCDLEIVKKKSDFGPNGEFLGNQNSLPAFFPAENKVSSHDFLRPQPQHDDQSHQPSIDALLGEDPMRFSGTTIPRRSAPVNPLFSMAISQANDSHRSNSYLPQAAPVNPRPTPSTHSHPHPPPQQQQQQTNYQLLKQFEQMLINKQVPPQERLIYIKAMMEKMQREALNSQQRQYQQQQQQQPTARMMNFNSNAQESFSNRGHPNPLLDAQRQQQQQQQREASMRSLAIGEMMERARLAAAAATNSNRSQSPSMVNQTSIQTQMIDALQRSEQLHISETNAARQQHQQSSANVGLSESPSSPLETNVSPTSRTNRPKKSYPRPPLLNTWQGRGSDYDEFAGLMTDREKQWVVKIQLHQVSQTEEEDYYFHKWSQQKRHMQQVHGNQSARSDQRTQYISYPVLQLLKSIQQEKELTQRTCQSSISNLNPSPAIPYASALTTQLGKQSTATPRHPKFILHLDGELAIGTRANAITHDKYTLGLLLNIENIYRDILCLDNDADEDERAEKSTSDAPTPNSTSSIILDSIIDRYLNHSEYLFADLFAQFNKGQILLERLYPYLITTISTSNHLELMLIRLYGSLNYMVRCWSPTFHIEPIVMNMISLMQQQVNVKKTTFEQLLAQIYSYYDEQIKPKLAVLSPTVAPSPFSDPILFTNPHTITILIELLLTLERRCYLLAGLNSSALPVQLMQQLQPQLQYQLSEHVRLLVTDLCQALVNCSTPKKMFKPFAQVQQQQFVLLCKFLRIQIPAQTYAALEGKLIVCCIKEI